MGLSRPDCLLVTRPFVNCITVCSFGLIVSLKFPVILYKVEKPDELSNVVALSSKILRDDLDTTM